MNDIIAALYARKSAREFEDRAVPDEVKRQVYLAACQAPSAGNQQLYTILDITDEAVKQRLSVLCDNQPMIAKAPMVAVFLADQRRWHRAYVEAGLEPRGPELGDIMLAVTDAAIAAQNAVVASESLGLGSCYIGDIMERCEDVRELLKLPKWVFPCCMLIFGYPTKSQIERKKPARFNLEHIVRENYYRDSEGDELRAMFAERQANAEQFDYDKWMTAFCTRKYASHFAHEMNRSVAKYLKQFSPEG